MVVAVAPAREEAGFMGRAFRFGTVIAQAGPVLATGRDGAAEPDPAVHGGTAALRSATAAQVPPDTLRHASRKCCPICTDTIRTHPIRPDAIPWRALAMPIHDAPSAPPAGPDQAAIPYTTTAAADVAPIPTSGLPPEPAIPPLGPA